MVGVLAVAVLLSVLVLGQLRPGLERSTEPSASPATAPSAPEPAAPTASPLPTPGSVPASDPTAEQIEELGLTTDPSGRPVRWDTCGPIDYLVRPGPGPADAVSLVHRAFAELAAATGLAFRFAGTTDDLPTDLPDRTIQVSWATPEEVPELEGTVAGQGGPQSRSVDGGPWRVVAAEVELDATEELEPGFGSGASVGGVLLHELGHAVGLTHVDDRTRLMYPSTLSGLAATFQPGDLAALAAAVDRRPCG